MIITDVQQQKRNTSRFNLYIDNKFYAGISANTLAKFNLYKEKEIDEEELQKILYQDLKQRFTDRVINNIARSPKTEFQIRRYLNELSFKKKGDWFDKEIDIDSDNMFNEIVETLKELELLNDRTYAQLFVESRIKNKPRGKYVLISELISKGVDKNIAKEVCDELIEDEYDILKRTYYKKYKTYNLDLTDIKRVRYLQRKGFSYDLIKEFAKNESAE
ncbi:MAG: RecX family transcriptional regulator [Candidatus Dojkabacteria bacterium]|nr:RecX family transcriptional regulator [Candidatus Dojkabacteria bacterium]